MPYPFAQCPTFAEFKQKLKEEFDCDYLQGPPLKMGDGGPSPINYFQRVHEGETLTCVIDAPSDDTRIEFDLIRSICSRLKIPLEAFGLDLG